MPCAQIPSSFNMGHVTPLVQFSYKICFTSLIVKLWWLRSRKYVSVNKECC